MEDQSSASGRSTSRLLRYPLQSAKKEKPQIFDSSSAPRRGRPESSVSKSIAVLDLFGKEKPPKLPRRLSIPISEARAKRSSSNQGKNITPVSDVTKSSSRKKSIALSSASYWLSQIKLSESAVKHSVSLGFFKLAVEAGCEPLQRMKDELKSYARKHNLSEFGDSVKELFEKYNISEDFEQLQVSKTCSHVPDEGTRTSDEDARSSSVTEIEQLKPKSSNTYASESKQVKESNNETTQKNDSVMKTRRSANKNASNSKSALDTGGYSTRKKSQKPKQESNKDRDKAKKPGKKSAQEEGSIDPVQEEKTLEENKENKDTPKVEEISSEA